MISERLAIRMKLSFDGDQIGGTYAYGKIGKDLQLKGTRQPNDQFVLKEFDEKGRQTGTFSGF